MALGSFELKVSRTFLSRDEIFGIKNSQPKTQAKFNVYINFKFNYFFLNLKFKNDFDYF